MMGIFYFAIGMIYLIKPNVLNIVVGIRRPLSVHYKIYKRFGGFVLIIFGVVLFAAKKTVLTI